MSFRDRLVATHVDERTRERLHELARKQDRSLAAVLRIAVERELERHDDEQEEA